MAPKVVRDTVLSLVREGFLQQVMGPALLQVIIYTSIIFHVSVGSGGAVNAMCITMQSLRMSHLAVCWFKVYKRKETYIVILCAS